MEIQSSRSSRHIRWYNIPPVLPKKAPKAKTTPLASVSVPSVSFDPPINDDEAPDPDNDADSKPLNFDTFVPNHDPSLHLPNLPHPHAVPGPDYVSQYLPGPPGGSIVSQDEAFSRALGAMYWGGYWTAVYHVRNDSLVW